jgi:uracil-DNA glycosylase family 4
VNFKKGFNVFIDSTGLFIAIIVQLGVMTISMLKLAPGNLEAIGFVMSGAAIVLFAPRAFSKWMRTKKQRYIINYVMLEMVTLFFGWSFLLSGTLAQTESYEIQVTAENDAVLEELYTQRDDARVRLQEKREEFDQSTREETIRSIQAEQELIQSEVRDLNSLISERLSLISSGEVTEEVRKAQSGRSADIIFNAIPDAVNDGRGIQVFIWFIFVGSISLMIINSLRDEAEDSEPVKKKNGEEIGMAGFMEIEKKPIKTLKKEPRMSGCETCKAYELCKSPKFSVYGKGKKKIMVVFDHVTAREDRSGDPFTAPEHRYFFSMLEGIGLNRDDIWVTHAVQCYQSAYEGKDTPVSPQSIAGCHSRLIANIQRLQPEKIIIAGPTAMKTLYHNVSSGRFSFADYKKFPGFTIPDQNLQALVIPVFNPEDALAELERRKKGILKYRPQSRFAKNLWEDDYLAQTDSFRVLDTFIKKQLRNGLSKHFEIMDVPEVTLLETEDDIRKFLREINKAPDFAFDIETTGLKPYAEGHEIYTWGFSDGKGIWAFRHPREERTTRLLKKVLTNGADKYGWNIKYEIEWVKHFLDIYIANWKWDGVIGSHVIDNRPGITSLKFQTFALNGIAGYDAEIDAFLSADDEKNPNAINRIKEADLPRLLQYNGEDAWHTYIIAKKQMPQVLDNDNLKHGYSLFHKGQQSLCEMTINGFKVDTVALQKNYIELDKRAMNLYQKIMSSPEVKDWQDFNPNSGPHLIELFYDRLDFPVIERTKNGQPSTTTDVLRGFYEVHGVEIANLLADYKAAVKTRDTFLDGIRRAVVGDTIHPDYSLNLVASYRSSSQNPNFQNIPKRDEEMMKMIRSVFVPREGYVFLDVDYTSLEGFMGCNYHKDKVMAQYLLDEDTDMHADTAQDLFKIKKEDIDPKLFKKMRSVGKTANFALQYGSSSRMLGYNLWHGHLTNELKAELAKVGIESYDDWLDHTKEIYRVYWEERFEELNEWRKRQWETYIRKGYVVSQTGFLYTSLMTMNQVGNYPIQGSGFHVLLQGINSLTEEIQERGMRSRFVAEIHDSFILEVPEDEIGMMKSLIKKHFITDVKDRHLWITMPLRMTGEVYRENWSSHDEHEEFTLAA